ncbi:MAG TPA: ABC transporter permease [Thermomicrobiales bacterium]|nr:ABC transporter permease [Thermomicrobiales bacterium]
MASSQVLSGQQPQDAQQAHGRLAERPSFWRRTRRRMNTQLVLGLGLLALILIATIFAPLIAQHGPNTITETGSLAPPQAGHPFGTDSISRDVFSRVLYGGRVSLTVAIPSVALALLLGMLLGVPAGYLGGKVDQVIMRVLDVFFAFPGVLLALVIVTILGPNIRNLILTIGILYAPRMARIVRAPTLSTKSLDFVEAARSIGAHDLRIVLRHVIPNVSSPVIVDVSLALGQVILTETALSFLGMGPPPPAASWGSMLSQSRQFMEFASWTVMAPGIAIVITVSCFLLIGHGLRRMLDPRQQRKV